MGTQERSWHTSESAQYTRDTLRRRCSRDKTIFTTNSWSIVRLNHGWCHRTWALIARIPMITTLMTWLANALLRVLITAPHSKQIGRRSSHHVWPYGQLNGNWRVWAAMIHPVASRSGTCSLNYESAFLNGRKEQIWEHPEPYYNEIIVRHFRSCAGAETVKQITERRTVWIIHSYFTFLRAAARMLPHQCR